MNDQPSTVDNASQCLTLDIDTQALAGVPHIDQWAGPWAIMPERLRLIAEAIRVLDIRAHLSAVEQHGLQPMAAIHGGDRYGPYASKTDGIVIIGASGPLMKHRASLSDEVSTVMLRRSIRAAARDAEVRGIMLVFDSPGGTVAGTHDLAADIAAAAAKKPTHGYAEDLAASAAYWGISQTSHISAGPTSLIGSIGTFAVVEDYSQAAENAGIKVHVIKAGEFKGAGVLGTEITDRQLGYIQQRIESLNEHFLAGVESGRKLSRATVRSLNDGRVHLADDAKALRLIDAVESFDEALERLDHVSKPKRSFSAMSTETTTTASDQVTADASAKPEKPAAPGTGDARSELSRYMKTFGNEKGAEYFAAGLNYTEACEEHIDHLRGQVTAANERADQAEEKLAKLDLGEETAVDTGPPAAAEKRTFAEATRRKKS